MTKDREERNTVLGMPRDVDPYARQGEEPQHVLGVPVTGTVPSIRICCSSSDIPSRHTSTGRYAAAWVFTHLKKVTQSHCTDPIQVAKNFSRRGS